MELDKALVFYHVAQEGSLSKASVRLNISQSALSRTISILEYSLRTTLFIRHSKGLILTEDGETLFHHMRNIISESETAVSRISQKKQEVEGKITIASTYGFMSTSLFQHLGDFLLLYPKVRMTIICDDENLDLKVREADVSIRDFDSKDKGELRQVFLTTRIQHLYANPEYLKRRGMPKVPSDLDQHDLIVFNNALKPLPYGYGSLDWILSVGRDENTPARIPSLIVNSVESIYQAAVKGLGIISLSQDSVLLKNKDLIHVLPEFHSQPSNIYFTYPVSLSSIKLFKILEKFLTNKYKAKDSSKGEEK